MSIVMVLDQRDSRSGEDLVEPWTERLNRDFADELRLAFARTAGDEMQALIGDASALGRIVREAVANGNWTIGVGIGAVESPLPDDVRKGRGPAFWAARDALEKAKGRRRRRLVCVRPADESRAETENSAAGSLERCLGALAFIVARRTKRQGELADAYYRSGYSLNAVITEFGLSPQGARQRLNAAGAQEEKELIELAAELAHPVVEP